MSQFEPGRSQDAYFVIRGFVYQVQITVKRWLELQNGHSLILERGEDIDNWPDNLSQIADAEIPEEERKSLLLEQIKCIEHSATLTAARMALANFDSHRRKNPNLPLKLRYTTNAKRGTEKPRLLTSFEEPGITVWEKLGAGSLDEGKVKTALDEIKAAIAKFTVPPDDASEGSKLIFANFQETFRVGDDATLLDFIQNVEWATATGSPDDLRNEIKEMLVSSGLAKSSDESSIYYRFLFAHTFELLSQPGDKILTRDSLITGLAVASNEREASHANRIMVLLETLNEELSRQFAEVKQEIRASTDEVKGHIDLRIDERNVSESVRRRLDDSRSSMDKGRWLSAEGLLKELRGQVREIVDETERRRILARIADAEGVCRWHQGDQLGARSLFSEALRYVPDHAPALNNLALYFLDSDPAKAVEIASRARLDPDIWSRATAMWLRGLFKNDGWERVEEELQEDPSIKSDAVCAAALAEICLRRSDVVTAQSYINTALNSNRTYSTLMLYVEILTNPVSEAFEQFAENGAADGLWIRSDTGQWTQEAENRFREIVVIYEEILDLLSSWEVSHIRADVLAAKAAAHLSINDLDEAANTADLALAAVDLHPKATNLRLQIYAKTNTSIAAIPLLRRLKDSDKPISARVDAAISGANIFSRNQDFDQVIEWLHPFWDQAVPASLVPDMADLLLRAHQSKRAWEAVARYRADLEKRCPQDPWAWFVLAQQAQRERRSKVATRYLELAWTLVRQGTWPDHLKRLIGTELAYIHATRGHYTRASILLAPLVNRTYYNEPLNNFVVCLFRLERYREAYQVARSVRASGRALKHISIVEAEIASLQGDTRGAISLRSDLFDQFPEDLHNVITLASLYKSLGNFEAARAVLAKFPLDAIWSKPKLLMQLAVVAAELDMPEALEWGYRARKLAMADASIHAQYVMLCRSRSENPEEDPLLSIEVVQAETSVKVRHKNKTEVFTLTESPILAGNDPFQIDVREPITDPRAKELMGKRVGNRVALRTQKFGEDKHEIIEILSKFIWASHESLQLFGQGVLHHDSLTVFEFDPDNPQEMIEHLRILQGNPSAGAQVLLDFYLHNAAPISTITKLRGISLLDGWANGYGMHFIVSEGIEEELEDGGTAFKQVIRKGEIVLDESAILSIVQFDIVQVVSQSFGGLVVPQAVRDEFAKMVASLGDAKFTRGWLQGEGEDLAIQEYTAEMHTEREAFWKATLDFIDTKTQVVPVNALMHLSAEERELYSLPTLASVLLAHERSACLYSDDLRVRAFAKRKRNIPGIWTNLILLELTDAKATSEADYLRILDEQISARYGYLPVTGDILVHICQRHNWQLNQNVMACLQTPARWMLTDGSALQLVSDFVWSIWNKAIPLENKRILFNIAIQNMVHGRMVVDVLTQLKSMLRQKEETSRTRYPSTNVPGGKSLMREITRVERSILHSSANDAFKSEKPVE